MGDKDVE
jgi:hypothetical protein